MATNNPKLDYITFDELMSMVESDLNTFADNAMIDRGKVIKVVMRINADLGLKINKEKETLVNVENYTADTPSDFFALNLAFACGLSPGLVYEANKSIFGTVTEEHTNTCYLGVQYVANPESPGFCATSGDTCSKFYVTQRFQDKLIQYPDTCTVKLSPGSLKLCSDNCLNRWAKNAQYEIDFDNSQILTGFKCGKLYLNYISDMVDIEDNLLVLAHPKLIPYYEMAVKKHLLENWMLNSNADVGQKLGYIRNELKDARSEALSFISTVEPSQIQKTYKENRRVFYNRYMAMFDC